MKNNTCIVCSETFEPKEGKLYCSDSCRTKAYNERKSEKKPDDLAGSEPGSEPSKERKKIPILYSFDLSEYAEMQKEYKNLSFEMFCFIRKNLSGKSDLSVIKDYFSKIYKNNLDDFETQYQDIDNCEINSIFKPVLKQYTDFLELFHSGQVEIFDSKKTSINSEV